MKYRHYRLSILAAGAILVAALGGCALADRNAAADALAEPAHLQRVLVRTDDFVLTTFSRITDGNAPINIYIEGDGLAWLSRGVPSRDPTPRTPLALALAASDKAVNVVYIARPCQYTLPEMNPRCSLAYWTDKRYAPEVIKATSQAIDQFTGGASGREINLIGYSGGGAVAVLTAAGRRDVASIRTVAGNLDHEEVNRLHRVSPMSGSLNAIDHAAELASLPQIHFSGSDDETVPPIIAQHFRDAARTSCVKAVTIPGATHSDGWTERWPGLLARTPSCD